MADIYSVRLSDGAAAAAGDNTVFTAPATNTVVVRCITLRGYSGTTSVICYRAGGGTLMEFDPTGGADQVQTQNGRWVLNPGEVLHVGFAVGGGQWFISGYSLTP